MHWLSMGGYGLYVWLAYGLTWGGIVGVVIVSRRALSRVVYAPDS